MAGQREQIGIPASARSDPSGGNALSQNDSTAQLCTRGTVLLVSPDPEDRAFLDPIFSPPAWKSYWASSYREGLTALIRDRMNVVICDRQLPDGSWKDLLSHTQTLTDPPRFIVSTKDADASLWAEVLNEGGYDMLLKPFAREEVMHVAARRQSRD